MVGTQALERWVRSVAVEVASISSSRMPGSGETEARPGTRRPTTSRPTSAGSSFKTICRKRLRRQKPGDYIELRHLRKTVVTG